jgi:hypothetical protein
MNIRTRVKTALAPLGLPVGHLVYKTATGQAMPATWLEYQVITDLPDLHANNREVLTVYRVQVKAYTSGDVTALPDINSVMAAAGFLRVSAIDLPYEADTKLFGVAMDYRYTEDKI